MKNRFFTRASIIFIAGLLCFCSGDIEGNEYPEEMQQFVVDISTYAKSFSPYFIIIPQNGAELVFNGTGRSEGYHEAYINAIDGIGIEELFYNDRGKRINDKERLLTLKKIKKDHADIQIMVSDFVKNNSALEESLRLNTEENSFIAFPRLNNYDYMEIPSGPITGENNFAINKLSDARNYLYLISPDKFDNKQDMITKIKATNYDVVIIDMFFIKDDNPTEIFTKADINDINKKPNGEKRLVISYISIGSLEKFRYYWNEVLNGTRPSWAKKSYDGYPDEYWIQFWNKEWQDIIFGNDNSYIKKISDAGFDGAYLDNVEAYYFLEND